MRKRINNDLKISWEILRNGQAEDFTTATNIAVKAVIPNAYSIEVPYERIDNLFHIAVPANTLKLGTYHLILSYNKPDATIEGGLGTISIDQKNAFQIVRHTEDESDDGRDITGNIVVPGIPSGGSQGQFLVKINSTSYNTEWKSPEQSTGVSTINIMSQKAITDALELKVDKVEGKQLSTEDYSTAEKNKLSGIAESANNYVHPTNHPPSIITQDENNRFVTDVEKGIWSGKQGALGFTPENVANKKTSIADNDTDYPSSKAVKTFVEAAVAQKSFYANTMTVNFGTLNQGVVGDLGALGGTDVIIQEISGANPLQVTFDFANVTEVTGFVFYGEYLGGAMHQVYIEVYNYTSLAWDLKLIIGTEGSKKWYTAPIYNANAYLSSGNMQVRFRHIGNGISSHQLVLDYVEINSGGSGGQTNISASSVNFSPTGNLSATNVASALVELDTEKVATSLVGAVSGLAQLDSTGKHKIEQYQDIILGQLKYGGTFNNDGIITSDYSTLNDQDIDLLLATDWKGFFFIFAGTTATHHSIEFEAGDWLISNGSAGWVKVDNTDAVTLVNGKKGNVTLATDDIAEGITPTNLWFTAARVRATLLTDYVPENSAITANDTVLQLANKAQGQISDIVNKINASALTANYLSRWEGSKFVNSVVREDGGNIGIGVSPTHQLTLSKSISLPPTTASDIGVIYKGSTRLIHDFNRGNNGVVTTAGFNLFFGQSAGNFTMGATATNSYEASYNNGFGTGSLANLVKGFNNVGLGVNALQNLQDGFDCVAIGKEAGRYLDGYAANNASITSIFIGGLSRSKAAGCSNEIVIGYDAIGAGSNSVTLGNSSIVRTVLRGAIQLAQGDVTFGANDSAGVGYRVLRVPNI